MSPALIQLLQIVAVAVGATVVIVGVAIAAYAFGSFLLMGRHVGARELGASIRALVRELWVAGWTQPLIPLFYLVGHRMDGFFRRTKQQPAKRGEERKNGSLNLNIPGPLFSVDYAPICPGISFRLQSPQMFDSLFHLEVGQ